MLGRFLISRINNCVRRICVAGTVFLCLQSQIKAPGCEEEEEEEEEKQKKKKKNSAPARN
jgi:hypothetical protein